MIRDNLGSHKDKAARHAVHQAGAHVIFLPPYSPDLNPIEQLFAKLKCHVRKAEPRTVEETWQRVGKNYSTSSPNRMRKLPQNAGYASV